MVFLKPDINFRSGSENLNLFFGLPHPKSTSPGKSCRGGLTSPLKLGGSQLAFASNKLQGIFGHNR